MVALVQYILFSLILFISTVSTRRCGSSSSSSITCYIRYELQQSRRPFDNSLTAYSYHQAEITVFSTLEHEKCATVGCVCFSYKASCSHSSPGLNHHSKCNDTDRQRGTVQWHYGWTSTAKCEEMRQQPQRYTSLTCCSTNLCNDQPGLLVHEANDDTASQYYNSEHKPGESYTAFVRSPNISQLLHNLKPWEQYRNHGDHPAPAATQRPNDEYQPTGQQYRFYPVDSGSNDWSNVHQPAQTHESYGGHQHAGQPIDQGHQQVPPYYPYPANSESYDPSNVHQPQQSHDSYGNYPAAAQPANNDYQQIQPYHVYSPDSISSNLPQHDQSSQSTENYETVPETNDRHKSSKDRTTSGHHSTTTSSTATSTSTLKQSQSDEKQSPRTNSAVASSFINWMVLFSLSFGFHFIVRSY